MALLETGYGVIKLKGDAVWRLRSRFDLESFNPQDFFQTYKEMVDSLHQAPEWKEIITDNLDILKYAVGRNIKRQTKPYLRISRPGNTTDTVGIHRDTHYGATVNEWVLWVPLTDAVDGGELRILPGSHLNSDEFYPWVQEKSPDVERGSLKHWLGYMYAPKRMSAEVEDQCVPVPCKVGEAILFNCACVHGAKVNTSSNTRFSIDMRLVDASKPTQAHGIHGENYEAVC